MLLSRHNETYMYLFNEYLLGLWTDPDPGQCGSDCRWVSECPSILCSVSVV